jgi:hypothetical protein
MSKAGLERRLRASQLDSALMVQQPDQRGYEPRLAGARGVDNHINPAVQAKLGEAPRAVVDNVQPFLQALGVSAEGQDRLNRAYLDYLKQRERDSDSALPPLDVLNEQYQQLVGEAGDQPLCSPAAVHLLIHPYVRQCQLVIEHLYRAQSLLGPVQVEQLLLYNDVGASFSSNRMSYLMGINGAILPAEVYPAIQASLGIDGNNFPRLALAFYHFYAFFQLQKQRGLPYTLEALQTDFYDYMASFTEANPTCFDSISLMNSGGFLDAVETGSYDFIYSTIVASYEDQAVLRLSEGYALADWQAEIGAIFTDEEREGELLTEDEYLTVMEKLVLPYEDGGSVLDELVALMRQPAADFGALKLSGHAIPLALPYVVKEFFSGKGLTEVHLQALLQAYLLDDQQALDAERFVLLMEYSKRPYLRTDRTGIVQGQLGRLNMDLVFELLAQDEQIVPQLAGMQLAQIKAVDPTIGRAIRSFVVTAVSLLTEQEHPQSALQTAAGFQDWATEQRVTPEEVDADDAASEQSFVPQAHYSRCVSDSPENKVAELLLFALPEGENLRQEIAGLLQARYQIIAQDVVQDLMAQDAASVRDELVDLASFCQKNLYFAHSMRLVVRTALRQLGYGTGKAAGWGALAGGGAGAAVGAALVLVGFLANPFGLAAMGGAAAAAAASGASAGGGLFASIAALIKRGLQGSEVGCLYAIKAAAAGVAPDVGEPAAVGIVDPAVSATSFMRSLTPEQRERLPEEQQRLLGGGGGAGSSASDPESLGL